MDNFKQWICDWLGVTQHVRLITVKFANPQPLTIPEGAILVLTVSPDFLDSDLIRLREEVWEFFEGYKVAVIRAGDIQFGIVLPEHYHTPDRTMEAAK